jgi:hypothetical protein
MRPAWIIVARLWQSLCSARVTPVNQPPGKHSTAATCGQTFWCSMLHAARSSFEHQGQQNT